MKLLSMKSRLKVALAGVIIAVGTLVLQTGASIGSIALAQDPDPQPTGSIQRIIPSLEFVNVGTGGSILLSVSVVGRQDVQDQNLAKDPNISWSASGGKLEVHYDTTRATYLVPRGPGTYTVTASAGSQCVGNATDCNATFTLRARFIGPYHIIAPRMNPPGEIPTALIDAEGNQYNVFTPAEGGTFKGGNYRIVASHGDVPSGELIGVRMFENGPASNAGMSHQHHTLSGNQYKISIIDAEGIPIVYYTLNRTVEVCIPVPEELRSNLSSIVMVTKNSNGTLTAMLSSVRISPSLIICGNTSTLPATIAVGVPGTPPPLIEPEPRPTENLPATGGAAPKYQGIIAWVFLVGVALIATGTFATRYRHPRH